ncbi:hypothetical protein ACFLT9_13790 [Acidobacteriota bacterium]
MKKLSVILIVLLFCVNFISSQSLVELAKKEKERRARLKDKKIIVLTANSLKNKDKKSAVISTRAQATPVVQNQEENESPSTKRTITPRVKTPPSKKEAAIVPEKLENRKDLEIKWNKAVEYVELLTLKMNALWQEFYSMNDMRSREELQRQIREAFIKLQAAQAEELSLKTKLDTRKR